MSLSSLPVFHLILSRVPELSRRIHNCAVASLLRSVPSVRLSLILSVILFLDPTHTSPTPTGTLSSGPSLEWVSPLPVIFTGVALTFLRSRVYHVLVPPLWKVQGRLGSFRHFEGFGVLF